MLIITLKAARLILPFAIGIHILLVGWFLISNGIALEFGTLEVRAEMGPNAKNMSNWEKGFRFLPHLAMTYGMLQLWFLFGAFLSGRTFSEEAVDHLTKFGLALIVGISIRIALNSFLGGPSGEIGLLVDQNQLFQLLIGFVFLLIARAFAQARGNADELERYF